MKQLIGSNAIAVNSGQTVVSSFGSWFLIHKRSSFVLNWGFWKIFFPSPFNLNIILFFSKTAWIMLMPIFDLLNHDLLILEKNFFVSICSFINKCKIQSYLKYVNLYGSRLFCDLRARGENEFIFFIWNWWNKIPF